MKKVLVVLSALLIAVSGFFFVPRSQAETSTQDQYCAPGVETSYEMLGAGGIIRSQTFEPTQNRITEVDIKIGGLNLNGGTPITLTLYGPGFDGPQLTTKTIMPTIGVPSTRSWTFAGPVTITPGAVYKLVLSTTGPGSVYWYYGTGDQSCDGDNRTYAFRDSTHMTWDWNYKTMGYTVADPSAPIDTTGNTTTTGSTTTTSDESLGTTTASIAKPLNLTAAYSQADGGVKVSWKASTTADIDGYKVFRSESQSSGYTKITETIKSKLDAIDSNIVAGKTYYYQVRAYKGSNQSVSSNTASVKIPDSVPPAKPIKLEVVDKTDSMLKVTWRKTEDATVTGYTINLYKGGEKVRTAELEAGDELYSFFDLDSATVYKVELIAKNAKDQTSSPAITYGYTQFPEEFENLIDTVRALTAVLVLILLLILAIRTKKHYLNK